VLDLFRYSGAGIRQLAAGQTAFMSPDGGTTNLDNFNTNTGGDPGDWGSSAGNDSFLAFTGSGAEDLVSESDLRTLDVMGWNLASPYTGSFSANGSTLMAGGSGSLVTSAGTWTFSAATGTGGNLILLNGQSIVAAYGAELEVANSGNLYADTSQGQWSEWTGSGWTTTTNPSNPPPPPASSLSPDGSILKEGGTGTLVSTAGTWTFNTPISGGYAADLNGRQVASNPPTQELEVANQGNLYALNSDGSWWEWNGSGWAAPTNPPSSPPPTTTPPPPSSLSPDGSILKEGGTGTLVSTAGTWTFNTPISGGYAADLNGRQVASNPPTQELEVANQGNLYALNSDGSWWEWNGSTWLGSGAPPVTSSSNPGTSTISAMLLSDTQPLTATSMSETLLHPLSLNSHSLMFGS
jgi:hypothetical protein